ncbi:hypothetical protein PHAVU_008G187200 [Phaseolus vulgaris]|uniref:Uncharacterized protein n=1 Tax=Phaseolus vulgaris TaxID=3885 RepID=V7B6X5_PHAVU|nr:hypothetical protein PHAVU_008G187200g [Phaseolus vulgaris]ESW13330.1 hypothetical protein PHAVU_008G187200g [Phaseolus vulgaris]
MMISREMYRKEMQEQRNKNTKMKEYKIARSLRVLESRSTQWEVYDQQYFSLSSLVYDQQYFSLSSLVILHLSL